MKFGNVKLPKELWMCEDEQARWFEFEQPHDLPDSVTVTKMIPEQAEKQEPVATVQCINGLIIGYLDVMQPVGTKLYTSPPPRQPLTDEEIDRMYVSCKYGSVRELARAIEAAHGIRSNDAA
jgi:hypothetical protein